MNDPQTRIDQLHSQQQAAKHPLQHPGPSVRFMEGALLGNGGMGVVVCVRPESIVLHFGHNDVWDIRLAEKNREEIGTFAEIFEKVDAISRSGTVESLNDDPWFRQYMKMCRENYAQSYPRPMPCGTVVLGFDRRQCEPLGYEVDISSGLCRIDMIYQGHQVTTEIFVAFDRDRLWARCVDQAGETCQPFTRIHVMPDPKTPKEFPQAETIHNEPTLGFSQVLPRVTEPGEQVPGVDHAFRLLASLPGSELSVQSYASHGWTRKELTREMGPLERGIDSSDAFALVIDLDHSDTAELSEPAQMPDATSFSDQYKQARHSSDAHWRDFWNASAVMLGDVKLERYWYHNLYFMRCANRPGVTCPGLFANWSYENVGSNWHGDYHMNYNTQQPFWMTYSSNHLELNLAYCDLVDHITPLAKRWAREYYDMPGAYYPHSAYPVEMSMNPYPVPLWGWEVHETPWTVQGLWWHYTYSKDEGFLRDRAFEPMKLACEFMTAYMLRPDASGERFGDDRYHIFPSVPPELYGLRLNFEMNIDPQTDVTLTRFLFEAFKQACKVLGNESEHRGLLDAIDRLLEKFPLLATEATSGGDVWTAVAGAPAELVQNCPASTMAIFPGEEVGIHSDEDKLELARRTLAIQQNEGGNELVFLNLQKARVGVLDLEKFKRQMDYCKMPNGTCTNMVLQTKGRYSEELKFDFMADMGVWFENFAIPAVINECLMQSWDGLIHLFPNWPLQLNATFKNLRALGAFLISATLHNSVIDHVTIHSEAGGTCHLINPWPGQRVRLILEHDEKILDAADRLDLSTEPGQTLHLQPLS